MKKMLLNAGFLGMALLAAMAADAQTDIAPVVYKKPVYCLRIAPRHSAVKKLEKADADLLRMQAVPPAEKQTLPPEPKTTAPGSVRYKATPGIKETAPTK